MAITEFAKQYHERMFPGYVSRFSGKTLNVSITHAGSSFSRTVSTIQSLEPDAQVIEGISIRGSAVPESENNVRQFVKGNS